MPEFENLLPKQKALKGGWLKDLAEFIVIANRKTWAADAAEVPPQRPGYKELQWPYPQMCEENQKLYRGWEDWVLRDSYTGYFRAPGMTTVYYKDRPAWTQSYGGPGMIRSHYDKAKSTFEFLKAALKKVTPGLPFRGPSEYAEENRHYIFRLEGDIEDFTWIESIVENEVLAFMQTGFGGIVIHHDERRLPVYPWDL